MDISKIDPAKLATFDKLMRAQAEEDWETFISGWTGDFTQTVGDPEAQDVIPFFGKFSGFDEYKKCIEDYANGHFKIVEYRVTEMYDMGDITYGLGDATYIFEPTGEIIHSKHLLVSRFDGDKICEGRRWMESIVYYKTFKKWQEAQNAAAS
ncbi:hypothetical protein [Ruegeria halocynthiae]|uniref:hypothetical protein n=1 Tax=Ruegeria halocynthiae TaxID=985054 RepID=UPI000564EA3A|nr:hypothetical protein [Ruegeria halocynthiae]